MVDKNILIQHISDNKSQREIALDLGCSQTKGRYWLDKYGLITDYNLKRSIIWSIPTSELEKVTNKVISLQGVLRELGISPKSAGSFYMLKKRLGDDGIDIPTGWRKNLKRKCNTPLSIVLVKNSTYDRRSLKKRLISEGLLKSICAICGMNACWNNKCLVLVLDHVNGVNNDNRLENLRLLCPNCNSQTDTFCGKNKKFLA